AADQGTDTRRLLLATRDARDSAADVAEADRCRTAQPGRRMAVSHRRGGNRLHGRVGLSDFPRAPLPGDGCDPAVRHLDHAAGLRDGLGAEAASLSGIPLGRDGALSMPNVSVKGLWKTYGDTVVLERLNLEVGEREFVTIVGASGCGKTTFLRMLLGMEQPTRGRLLIDGKAAPREPGPDRGIVFQRYSLFPHLTVLGNLVLGIELRRSRLLGKLF